MENTFVQRLNELKGSISKNAFAKKCGIKQTTMLGYLNGSSQPNLENLIKIAKAGNVNVAWLVGEEETVKAKAEVRPHMPDKAMRELAQWIAEQDDGLNYWEVAKVKMAQEFPEFREWLKKRASNKDTHTPPENKSVNSQ